MDGRGGRDLPGGRARRGRAARRRAHPRVPDHRRRAEEHGLRHGGLHLSCGRRGGQLHRRAGGSACGRHPPLLHRVVRLRGKLRRRTGHGEVSSPRGGARLCARRGVCGGRGLPRGAAAVDGEISRGNREKAAHADRRGAVCHSRPNGQDPPGGRAELRHLRL